MIPVQAPRRQGGGKRRTDDRAVLAAIVYLVQGGLFVVEAAIHLALEPIEERLGTG